MVINLYLVYGLKRFYLQQSKRKPILFKKISWVIKLLLNFFGFLVVLAVQ